MFPKLITLLLAVCLFSACGHKADLEFPHSFSVKPPESVESIKGEPIESMVEEPAIDREAR